MDRCDIAIVGAGAAGLTAGIFAAETVPKATLSIVVLESAPRIGAKILISGGGRCNVTHDGVRPDDFNGSRNIIRNILAAFDAAAAVRWFASLGVLLKREDSGKFFPVTDRARSVVDALLRRCTDLHVAIRTRHRVRNLRVVDGGFEIEHEVGRLHARRAILATGGRSLPRTGSDGLGWEIARRLGHTVTATCPALVPLILSRGMFHAELSGVSQPVELSTFADGKRIDRRSGSLLWTHFGISGPVVLDASRHWVGARMRGQEVSMQCNFLPGETFEAAERHLLEAAATRPRASIVRLLAARLPDRMAVALTRAVGVDSSLPMSQLTREQRRTLVHALTAFELPLERDRGWNYAEVTAGGVPLDEIDYRTMQSRKLPGLY
ncbi:MAG TPA: aminoacetone oxidase family FAD-binding enzyme, partial [Candidatus Kryptonia bacterium]|nr:aminoacetone oxidase family FAD-binding enzyme [Candidatus Kryptonia bacterium]